MKEAQTVTDFADASHSKSAKSTATTVLYGIFRSENSYLCAMTKHVQYTLLLYIRKVTVYNNYRILRLFPSRRISSDSDRICQLR